MGEILINIWVESFLIVFILAFCLDLIVGDPYWFPHPVIFIGRLVAYLERVARSLVSRLINRTPCKDRPKPIGEAKALKASGLAIWLITVVLSYLIAYAWSHIFDFNTYLDMGMTVLAMCTCLSTRCLVTESKKVYRALDKGDLDLARRQLSYIVGRDTKDLKEKDIIRATVATVAENTVDGSLAPMFYYILGGLPMAFAYKAVNTMDSMLGYKNEKYRELGYFPARLDDVFNYIPARLSLIFFALASLVLTYDFRASIRIGLRDRKNHTSPNCAYPEGAVAGALGIRLGGTNTYFGQLVYKPSIGDEKKDLEASDIVKANRLLYVSSLVGLVFFCISYLLVRALAL